MNYRARNRIDCTVWGMQYLHYCYCDAVETCTGLQCTVLSDRHWHRRRQTHFILEKRGEEKREEDRDRVGTFRRYFPPLSYILTVLRIALISYLTFFHASLFHSSLIHLLLLSSLFFPLLLLTPSLPPPPTPCHTSFSPCFRHCPRHPQDRQGGGGLHSGDKGGQERSTRLHLQPMPIRKKHSPTVRTPARTVCYIFCLYFLHHMIVWKFVCCFRTSILSILCDELLCICGPNTVFSVHILVINIHNLTYTFATFS